MKRFWVIFLVCSVLFISSLAQNPVKRQNPPQENSKVTKEYDEKGNLIKFDSLYTYSWSGGDTTMLKSFSPKDFPELLGDHFGFSDSIFNDNSFFDGFDQLFAQPFNGVRDSMLMKRFEKFHNFQNLDFPNDSIALNFNLPDNFFDGNRKGEKDSLSSKSPHHSLGMHPKSMEEMMQVLQLHMKEMEEYQKKFFMKPSK